MVAKSLQRAQGFLSGSRLYFRGAQIYGIGLDLGSACSKIVVLKKQGPQWVLLDWAIDDVFPPDHIHASGMVSRVVEGSVPQKILDVLKKNGCEKSKIGISVGGPRIFIKFLSLPAMTEEDVREHVKWELDRYFAPEMGEVLWDIHVGPGSSSDRRVLLVGAKKDYIEDTVLSLRELGLHVGFVDIDVTALANTVTCNYGQEGAWLVSHMGPSGILFLVIQGGELIWRREVAFAAEWYGDLVDQMRIKQTTSNEVPATRDSEEVLWEQFLDEVKSQLHEAVASFSQTVSPPPLSGILLSGGYSVVESMPSGLAQSLDIPVRYLDPFKKILLSPALAEDQLFVQSCPMLGVAVGVALGDYEFMIRINLARSLNSPSPSSRIERPGYWLDGLILLLFGLGAWWWSSHLVRDQDELMFKRMAHAQQLEQLQQQWQGLLQLEQRKQELLVSIEKLKDKPRFSPHGSELLSAIGQSLLKFNIWLDRVLIQSPSVEIRGQSLSGDDVGKWIDRLETVMELQEIPVLEILEHPQDPRKTHSFVIRFSLQENRM